MEDRGELVSCLIDQLYNIIRENLVARRVFPFEYLNLVGSLEDVEGFFPPISKTYDLPFDDAMVKKAALDFVQQEDTALLTGSPKFQGLATAEGRSIINSTGNLLNDIEAAMKQLKRKKQEPPYKLIMPPRKYHRLTYDEKVALADIDGFVSPFLFGKDGKNSNILVVKPSPANFTVQILRDFTVTILDNKMLKVDAFLRPNIKNANAICEIFEASFLGIPVVVDDAMPPDMWVLKKRETKV